MTKRILSIITLVILLSTTLVFTGCRGKETSSDYDSDQKAENQFGEFDSNGKILITYATVEISASEAKEIILKNANNMQLDFGEALPGVREDDLPLPSDEVVKKYMKLYSDCTAKTTYYLNDGKEVLKSDFLQGTDFKDIVENNMFTPFNQLVAKMIIVFPELIDYMEEQNKEFRESDSGDTVPFSNIFTYHKDQHGNLVIQCRDFAEIPSSEAGGVGCSYRQDTEIVFDSNNKISDWQTSLGVYTASPQKTIKQGYILKVNFAWTEKH